MPNYEPLYLKYRPQTLDDLIGQDSLRQTLTNAINQGRLMHAYLFTGPRGAGKTSSARILAKCLNCLEAKSLPTATPCGKCSSCLDIANSRSLDVVEIDAASHGGVEDARALIERVNLGTISGNYKVYIIDEVHMLSTAAFNALLKVFEEPPEKVVFILATTEEDKVLPTIKSRCQTLPFRPITLKDCVARMKYVAKQEAINIEDTAIEFMAKRSDGAMRDALGLLDQAAAFGQTGEIITKAIVLDYLGGIAREDAEELLSALVLRDASKLLVKLEDLFAQGKDSMPLVRELIDLALESLEERKTNLEDYELVQILEQLSLTEERLRRSTQSKNLMRASMLKICYRQDIVVARDLLERIAALEQNGVKAAPAKTFSAPTPKPVPVVTKPLPVATAPVVESSPAACVSRAEFTNAAQDYSQYLSPACKGLLSSSNARLANSSAGIATLQIPDRFKFLKTKIEAKSAEILTAISKSGSEVQTLVVEVVANDATIVAPPHLDTSYQEMQPRSLPVDEVAMDISEDRLETQSEQALEREEAPSVETEKVTSFGSARMQEAVSLAKSVFNAKVLDV